MCARDGSCRPDLARRRVLCRHLLCVRAGTAVDPGGPRVSPDQPDGRSVTRAAVVVGGLLGAVVSPDEGSGGFVCAGTGYRELRLPEPHFSISQYSELGK
jgi:hypothetical protein